MYFLLLFAFQVADQRPNQLTFPHRKWHIDIAIIVALVLTSQLRQKNTHVFRQWRRKLLPRIGRALFNHGVLVEHDFLVIIWQLELAGLKLIYLKKIILIHKIYLDLGSLHLLPHFDALVLHTHTRHSHLCLCFLVLYSEKWIFFVFLESEFWCVCTGVKYWLGTTVRPTTARV